MSTAGLVPQKLIEYLVSQGGAKAIFLCGSRSVGDFKKNSDWDFKILVDTIREFPGELDGYELDITQHYRSTKFSFDEFGLKLRYCSIILDNENKDA